MDTGVRRITDELVRSLHNCSEYRTFEHAKHRLDEDPARRKKADAFRRKNFLFQNSEKSSSIQAQEEMFRERMELRQDPVIREYLDAENTMCRLLRQISLRIMDSVDLDLDSMEDILS